MTAAPARALTPTVRQAARRGRWIAGSAAIVLVIALGTLLLSGGLGSQADFAPDNPGPRGARALAEVLRQRGVAVTVTRDVQDAARLATGGTLLVDDGGALLDAQQWDTLKSGDARLVVVAPAFRSIEALLPTARLAGRPAGTTAAARCDLPVARRAGSMSLAGAGSSLRIEATSGADLCFRDGEGRGQLARTDDGSVTLLASRSPFQNEHLGELGNAAVALTALGARPTLVWLRPDPASSAATARPTLESLTPTWATPMLVLALLAAVAAAFWRGRRLGPLVVEQLPVVVRSRETVEGRARLYARGGARLRAADALRIGTIGRLAPALGLSRLASVEQVVLAAAARTGRSREDLHALLVGAEPRSDADLVALSDDLGRLERAVAGSAPGTASAPRGPQGPPPPRPEGAP